MTFDAHIGMTADERHPDDFNRAMISTVAHHLNPTGNINGGVLISLADNLATGVASRAFNERFDEEAFLVGVDLHTVMVANQLGGKIYAHGQAVKVGRRITVVRTEVRGDDERLLAEVTTTHVPVPRP